MYYVYLLLVQIILSVVLYIVHYCIWRKQERRYGLILLLCVNIPFLTYNVFNPLYDGPIFTHLSDNRSPIQGMVIRNWGDTIQCKPAHILHPTTVEEVQDIVRTSDKIRVVGGGHSFSPLVCTEYTLLSLSKMDSILNRTDNTVTCQAGSSIKKLITRLLETEKIIHGFGSIQDQSLAGAFSTSHHGLTFNSFAEDVISISAVLANGTIFHTSDLYFWRSHLGLLGIITSMTVKTYPNSQVRVKQSKITIDEAIQLLPQADAGIIETNYNQRDQGLLKYITIVGGAKNEKYPIKTDDFVSAIWDSIVIPTVVLFPSLSTLPLLNYVGTSEIEAPMVEAWSKFPEYGMMYSAYAIPFENCSKFLSSIDSGPHSVSTILIRYLRAQENTTCLTFATKNACVVDVYDLQSQDTLEAFHLDIEDVVNKYGGMSHWGKYYVGDMQKQVSHMPCYETFKNYRDLLDPEQKFVNNYTREILNLRVNPNRYKKNNYPAKRIGFIIAFLISCTTTVYLLVAGCFQTHNYKLLRQ
jgi:hypothetical protein